MLLTSSEVTESINAEHLKRTNFAVYIFVDYALTFRQLFYFVAKLGANAIVMTMIITMTRRTRGRVCQEAEYAEKPGSK